MNCCDYNCNQGRDCPARRTCGELGVCQGRTPACPGFAHTSVVRAPFAPGVIQGGRRPVPLRSFVLRTFAAAVGLVSVAYALGYLVGMVGGA